MKQDDCENQAARGSTLRDPKCLERKRAGSAATAYDREHDLPRLIPLWPAELRDQSEAGQKNVLKKLEKALRAERQRGQTGHWSYDLDRHLGLVRAHKSESAAAWRKRAKYTPVTS